MGTARIVLQRPGSSPNEVYCIWGGETLGCLLRVFSIRLLESSHVKGVRGTRAFVREQEPLPNLGCDSNAHHIAWGSTNCNGRGGALIDFLNSSKLEILNRGNEPTFCSGWRQEVIDITLGSYGLLESIVG